MSILRPTVGQLWDRAVILGIKIERAPQHAHFQLELAEIMGALPPTIPPSLERLRTIHEAMFAAVAAMPSAEADDYDAILVAERAIRLQRLNRERYTILEQLDKDSGTFQGTEKI